MQAPTFHARLDVVSQDHRGSSLLHLRFLPVGAQARGQVGPRGEGLQEEHQCVEREAHGRLGGARAGLAVHRASERLQCTAQLPRQRLLAALLGLAARRCRAQLLHQGGHLRSGYILLILAACECIRKCL
jgi:hypothetical protein